MHFAWERAAPGMKCGQNLRGARSAHVWPFHLNRTTSFNRIISTKAKGVITASPEQTRESQAHLSVPNLTYFHYKALSSQPASQAAAGLPGALHAAVHHIPG